MDMDNYVLLPQHIASNNLKCDICQYYLSVPPIMTHDGTTFKCGRCFFIETNMNVKAVGFEKLAAFMMFPCSFEHCPKKIPWNQVQFHEISCPFRIIKCPCYHCSDTYEIRSIINHFNEKHKKYMSINQCSILNRNIKEPNKCLMRLLLNEGRPYLMFNYRDKEHFWFSVYSTDSERRKAEYEVRMTSLCGKFSVIIVNEQVNIFNQRENCINCLDRDCRSILHRYSQEYRESDKIYENMTTKIRINDIVSMLKSDTINYNVRITRELPDGEVMIDDKSELQKLLLLENLECPICRNYMSEPIFLCSTGHTICLHCKAKLNACPSCQNKLTNTRCYALEDISDKIKIDCKNKKLGCYFVGNVEQVREHETICGKEGR